jgi:ABC-2 type transport system ATP-binding protein
VSSTSREAPEPPEAAPVIRAQGLTRRFGPRVAVDSVDLTIERGEVFGCVGPNRAGKSTLCRKLERVLAPSAGSVEVLGLPMPVGAGALRPRIG